MRILITGARSPVAVEWARILMQQGCQVYLSDCCQFPLGKFVVGIHGYIKTTAPRKNPEQYQKQILELVEKYQIEMLVPTCEEIFYLAAFRHLFKSTNCLISDAELLLSLHDKYQLFTLLSGLPGIKLPETRKITSTQHIDMSWESILKPAFCRFGEHIIRDIKQMSICGLEINENKPWVQQQKLTGQALCNYALFDQGKMVAHQVYVPDYCVNQSAATYFMPIENSIISTFMHAFALKHHFHGQISFDFIQHKENIYVIECNPRATSGLHLIADSLRWPTLKKATNVTNNETTHAKFAGISMLIAGGIKPLFKQKTWGDFFNGKNVFKNKKYPLRPWAQCLSIGELCFKSLYRQKSLVSVSTDDIEWNGDR